MPAPKPIGITRPDLESTWLNNRNGDAIFGSLISRDPNKYWWICDKGHEFQATVRSRIDGRSCRVCLGHEIQFGINDFETLHPELAAMWHPTKNQGKSPSEIGVGGKTSYWWRCLNGHEYKSDTWAKILGKECRVCSGFRAEAGVTDFPALYPHLTKFLDTSKAKLSDLDSQHPGAEKKFPWRCKKGHTWSQSLRGMTTKRIDACSYCSNNSVWPGFNDLESNNPEVATEWDTEKNYPLMPNEVLFRADKSVYWLCKAHSHSWKTSIYKRVEEGSGCPYCSNYSCLTGFNDLLTLRPDIAAEWDYNMNATPPSQILAGSHKTVSWVCPEGHRWKAKPIIRSGSENRRGTGCPGCARYGFDASKAAQLYFIENFELDAFKIGITNKGTTRLSSFKGQGWKLIYVIHFDAGSEARRVELMMQRWIKKDLGLASVTRRSQMGRLGGQTETFSRKAIKKSLILQKIREIEAGFEKRP